MKDFQPPAFRPHMVFRGGHLQTLASLRLPRQGFAPDEVHKVILPDGDAIVLHENRPVDAGGEKITTQSTKAILLVHGLSGCHGSPYMIRWAQRLSKAGWTVYRLDMRGCGAAKPYARELFHAGRSGDNTAAMEFISQRHPDATLAAAGVSLGGNQLLRMAGRIGAGLDERPAWFDRCKGLVAVAPPIDLIRCSENLQRRSRRMYNYYFIRALFRRIPPRVAQQEHYRLVVAKRRPRTMRELDEQLTAPLSGFADAAEYYRQSSATSVVEANPIPTLVLAASDDPIVPVDCFRQARWPDSTRVIRIDSGGHAGFVGRGGQQWMDECVCRWLDHL